MIRYLARWTPLFALLLLFCVAPPAQAEDRLDTLRLEGVVIERWDGLLEVGDGETADADLRAFVDTINAGRMGIYEQRATENGVPVEEIGKVYAEQIFESAPSGTLFRDAEGMLVTKP